MFSDAISHSLVEVLCWTSGIITRIFFIPWVLNARIVYITNRTAKRKYHPVAVGILLLVSFNSSWGSCHQIWVETININILTLCFPYNLWNYLPSGFRIFFRMMFIRFQISLLGYCTQNPAIISPEPANKVRNIFQLKQVYSHSWSYIDWIRDSVMAAISTGRLPVSSVEAPGLVVKYWIWYISWFGWYFSIDWTCFRISIGGDGC